MNTKPGWAAIAAVASAAVLAACSSSNKTSHDQRAGKSSTAQAMAHHAAAATSTTTSAPATTAATPTPTKTPAESASPMGDLALGETFTQKSPAPGYPVAKTTVSAVRYYTAYADKRMVAVKIKTCIARYTGAPKSNITRDVWTMKAANDSVEEPTAYNSAGPEGEGVDVYAINDIIIDSSGGCVAGWVSFEAPSVVVAAAVTKLTQNADRNDLPAATWKLH